VIVRETFAGAWYADALPTGEYAVLFPHDVVFDANYNLIVRASGKMETHLGAFDLPDADEPLYHRITDVGRFEIGGQAHYSRSTWIWTPDTWWTPRGPACGVSPVIYDRLGVLHMSDCSIGSQGWRYVQDDGTPTGKLITGDNTYGPLHALNEFTDLGDGLIIGQGNPDAGAPAAAALLWDGAHHRMLEDGPCRFIRVSRDGDRLAIATWKQGFGAVLLWLTVADLRALPMVEKPGPAPAPVPVPAPPAPIPTPTPPPRPAPPKEPPVPAKTNDQVRADIAELVRFYNDPDGLNRAARGIPPPIAVDDPAFWDWVALSVTTPIEQVKARIRTFPEWVENHQGAEPP
jgi:hypothetical protein